MSRRQNNAALAQTIKKLEAELKLIVDNKQVPSNGTENSGFDGQLDGTFFVMSAFSPEQCIEKCKGTTKNAFFFTNDEKIYFVQGGNIVTSDGKPQVTSNIPRGNIPKATSTEPTEVVTEFKEIVDRIIRLASIDCLDKEFQKRFAEIQSIKSKQQANRLKMQAEIKKQPDSDAFLPLNKIKFNPDSGGKYSPLFALITDNTGNGIKELLESSIERRRIHSTCFNAPQYTNEQAPLETPFQWLAYCATLSDEEHPETAEYHQLCRTLLEQLVDEGACEKGVITKDGLTINIPLTQTQCSEYRSDPLSVETALGRTEWGRDLLADIRERLTLQSRASNRSAFLAQPRCSSSSSSSNSSSDSISNTFH